MRLVGLCIYCKMMHGAYSINTAGMLDISADLEIANIRSIICVLETRQCCLGKRQKKSSFMQRNEENEQTEKN